MGSAFLIDLVKRGTKRALLGRGFLKMQDRAYSPPKTA
jgi:hypothetical protein